MSIRSICLQTKLISHERALNSSATFKLFPFSTGFPVSNAVNCSRRTNNFFCLEISPSKDVLMNCCASAASTSLHIHSFGLFASLVSCSGQFLALFSCSIAASTAVNIADNHRFMAPMIYLQCQSKCVWTYTLTKMNLLYGGYHSP